MQMEVDIICNGKVVNKMVQRQNDCIGFNDEETADNIFIDIASLRTTIIG